MLSEITDTLLSDNNVRVVLEDVSTNLSNFVNFLLESINHISVLGHLHVGLGFTLLVLQRAVKQQNSWVSDLSSHLRMSNVLVEHDTIEDLALVEHTAGDLLNSGVSLDLEVELGVSLDASHDSSAGSKSEVDNQTSPSGGELGADTRGQSLLDLFVAVDVDRNGDVIDNLQSVIECLVVGSHDNRRMDLVLDEWRSSLHQLSCQTNNRCSTITHFLVLCSSQFDHRLGSWVLAVDLSQDSIAVVGHDDAAHWV